MKRRTTLLLISLGLAAALLVLGLLAGFVPQSEGPEVRRRASGAVARLRPEDMPVPIVAQGDGARLWAVRMAVASAPENTRGGTSSGLTSSLASGQAAGQANIKAGSRAIVSFDSGGVSLDTGEPAIAFMGDAQGDFAPLLALDGASAPLLVSNQPRDYGDVLDRIDDMLDAWLDANYSPAIVFDANTITDLENHVDNVVGEYFGVDIHSAVHVKG